MVVIHNVSASLIGMQSVRSTFIVGGQRCAATG
jgi:hypothetical protein